MPLYIVYVLLAPLLWALLPLAALFNGKIRTRLLEQASVRRAALARVRGNKGTRTLLLFHAASAGEFEQLKPVLGRIDRSRFFILQTFYSPTIYSKEKGSDLFDAVCYQPFDFPWSVRAFFREFRPRSYVITRHDVWPTHVLVAKRSGVRVCLINANMYEGSLRASWPLRGFNRWLFGNLDTITTGSDRLRAELSKLVSPERVEVTGDTRFDRVLERKAANTTPHFPERMRETRNILLGSILKSDHEVVFGGLAMRYGKGDASLAEAGHRLIIVPHEVDARELASVESQCRKIGIEPRLHSSLGKDELARTVIIDAVGSLADLYAYSHLAYVGGGFDAGVHSVIEPAAYGVPVSFGPNIRILDEAIALNRSGAGKMLRAPAEFAEFLSLLSDDDRLRRTSERTLEFVEKSRNAADRVLEIIMKSKDAGQGPTAGKPGLPR